MTHYSAFLISPSQKKELDQKPVVARLLELFKLEDGWLNGEGKSLFKPGAVQFMTSFEKYFNPVLPTPYLFPTPAGNLQAEWAINDFDVTLNVDLTNQFAFYHASSNQNELVDEMQLNLAFPSDWQQLVQKLATLSKG